MSKFLVIERLSSVSQANLNTDETGYPKTCIDGGVTRGRFSSQSEKQGMRKKLNEEDKACRTIRIKDKMMNALRKVNQESQRNLSEEELEKLANHFEACFVKQDDDKSAKETSTDESAENQVEQAETTETTETATTTETKSKSKAKTSKKKNTTKEGDKGNKTLIALSDLEYDSLADLMLAPQQNKIIAVKRIMKTLGDFKQRRLALDLALFGRMLAAVKEAGVEGALFMNHAVTTHAITVDIDYQTGIGDEVNGEKPQGANYIGNGYLYSGVFYHHININLDLLRTNLGLGDSPEDNKIFNRALRKTLRAIMCCGPCGKLHPQYSPVNDIIWGVYVTEKQPITLNNAFKIPVEDDAQCVENSIKRFKDMLRHNMAICGSNGHAEGFAVRLDTEAHDNEKIYSKVIALVDGEEDYKAINTLIDMSDMDI